MSDGIAVIKSEFRIEKCVSGLSFDDQSWFAIDQSHKNDRAREPDL